MILRLGKVVLAFALMCILGGNWALLQTVAWTTMLADNLQSNSLHDAMAMTFDGQHPCPLCRAIAAGKQNEKKNTLAQAQKLEFPLFKDSIVLIAPSRQDNFPLVPSAVKSLSEQPPTPPPRGLCA